MEPVTRPAFSLPSDNQIRLILATLVGVGVAIYLGVRVGEGDVKFVAGLLLLGAVTVIMGALAERAWLLLPFGMYLDVSVPLTFGRDFTIKELVSMALLIHTAIRLGLRRQKIVVFQKESLWPLLYTGWALMVFLNNPIGLQSFGAEVVGARFYFDIFLAFCNFVIVANCKVKESDAKWMFGLIFIVQIINIAPAILDVGYAPTSTNLFDVEEVYYTWHQAIAGPFLIALFFIYARYPFGELVRFRNLRLWIVIAIIAVALIYSGKRVAVGTLVVLPIAAAILQRRYWLGATFGVIAALVLGFTALAHGRWVNLPLNAQRALSWIPANWDVRFQTLGAKDEFRSAMREIAIEEIKKHPWLGPGFAMNVSDYWSDRATFGSRITSATAGHSWHTTWLGISADFGIPAAVIWGLLMWWFTRLGYRVASTLPQGDWRQTLAAFIFLGLCTDWLGSYTGGHSALSAFHAWWRWGLLIPLSRMDGWNVQESKSGKMPSITETRFMQGP